MIIKDEDAVKRLNSPMNLINRLKTAAGNSNSRKDAMSLFGINRKEVMSNGRTTSERSRVISDQAIAGEQHPAENTVFNPFKELPKEETKLDNILENHESQIKLGLAHDRALDLLNRSVEALSTKLDDVRADKLPAVISAASKTVESIRKERTEASKNNKDREVHYHFYTPEQKKLSEYEVIDVT